MTTIHADSPEGAIEQLVLLALSRADIRHYVSQAIDVFVRLHSGPRSRMSSASLHTTVRTDSADLCNAMQLALKNHDNHDNMVNNLLVKCRMTV